MRVVFIDFVARAEPRRGVALVPLGTRMHVLVLMRVRVVRKQRFGARPKERLRACMCICMRARRGDTRLGLADAVPERDGGHAARSGLEALLRPENRSEHTRGWSGSAYMQRNERCTCGWPCTRVRWYRRRQRQNRQGEGAGP